MLGYVQVFGIFSFVGSLLIFAGSGADKLVNPQPQQTVYETIPAHPIGNFDAWTLRQCSPE
jgi:hypothetical protein